MAWLETDFRPGDPLHRIKARWLAEVANALNTLDVELHDGIAVPYVERNYPGKWIIHLPAPGKGGGGAATEVPAAWMVKRNTIANSGSQGAASCKWQVFSPLWCAGRSVLLASGMERGWNDLGVSSGTLYAVLTWTGALEAGVASWTPGAPFLVNDLHSVPADVEPTAETPGSRSVVVEIGDFVEADGETSFRQAHLGVIVEDLAAEDGIPDGAEVWGKVSVETETDGSDSSGGKVTAYKLYQTRQAWSTASKAFVDKPGTKTLVGTIATGGGGGLPDGTLIPGAVEYIVETGGTTHESEPSSVKFVQHYLKWDASSGAFVAAGESADVVITELTSHAEDHAVQEESTE